MSMSSFSMPMLRTFLIFSLRKKLSPPAMNLPSSFRTQTSPTTFKVNFKVAAPPRIHSERPARGKARLHTRSSDLKSRLESSQTCELGDLTLMLPALGRLRQHARGLINGEAIVVGFRPVGNIFSGASGVSTQGGKLDYSSKTLSK